MQGTSQDQRRDPVSNVKGVVSIPNEAVDKVASFMHDNHGVHDRPEELTRRFSRALMPDIADPRQRTIRK